MSPVLTNIPGGYHAQADKPHQHAIHMNLSAGLPYISTLLRYTIELTNRLVSQTGNIYVRTDQNSGNISKKQIRVRKDGKYEQRRGENGANARIKQTFDIKNLKSVRQQRNIKEELRSRRRWTDLALANNGQDNIRVKATCADPLHSSILSEMGAYECLIRTYRRV